MKKYIIRNYGESDTMIVKEMTEEQYNFLNSLFEELNNDPNCGSYTPWISIWEATDADFENLEDRKHLYNF